MHKSREFQILKDASMCSLDFDKKVAKSHSLVDLDGWLDIDNEVPTSTSEEDLCITEISDGSFDNDSDELKRFTKTKKLHPD
ncbi:hypothetical protein HAX54_051251 [Datura stramonium]|uniref:Uncharacterized protein n=1 Tax=Datura stramonium TaxID=4076 RepID=A0ABS8WPN5_DATST|nr:hypothetical protein [Datura stramonium]